MASFFDLKTFNPEAFGKYASLIPNVRLNELIKSKAVRRRPEFKAALSEQTGAKSATFPLFGRLSGAPQNYDGKTDRIANSTNTYSQSVIVVGRMASWVERDFSYDITAGADFMGNIARQIVEYYAGVDEDTLIYILNGIYAMSGTSNQEFVEKHTLDITSSAVSTVAPETLNLAIQQASGDHKNVFTLAIMHSAVATNLENQKLLKYMVYNDANGIERQLPLATWNGRTVLVDDTMPTLEVNPGTFSYTTYILGDGAFEYEDVGCKNPYTMNYDPVKFGGQEYIHTKQRKVFAPYGISFTQASLASDSPTDAELQDGANWTLVNDGNSSVIPHKTIPIARIISRG